MALSKLAVRRLTKLADYMGGLSKEQSAHFNMRAWFDHSGTDTEHGLRRRRPVGIKELGYCGTAACALGWACTIPSFKRAGLSVIHDGIIGSVRFYGKRDFNAAEKFFELDSGQAMNLFCGSFTIKTPKQWAEKCRKFLRDNA